MPVFECISKVRTTDAEGKTVINLTVRHCLEHEIEDPSLINTDGSLKRSRFPPENLIDIVPAPKIVFSLSASLNRAHVPTDGLMKSQLVKVFVEFLKVNAAMLGLSSVSDLYAASEAEGNSDADSDSNHDKGTIPRVNVVVNRTRLPFHELAPVRVTLHRIHLHWGVTSTATKDSGLASISNGDHLFSSSRISLPYQSLVEDILKRFVTFHLVRRYPFIFGSLSQQLDIETPYFPSLYRSIMEMAKRSPNEEFRDKVRRLLNALKRQQQSRNTSSLASLATYLGDSESQSDIDVDPPEIRINSQTAFCLSMQQLFYTGIKRPRFKPTTTSNLIMAKADTQDDDELARDYHGHDDESDLLARIDDNKEFFPAPSTSRVPASLRLSLPPISLPQLKCSQEDVFSLGSEGRRNRSLSADLCMMDDLSVDPDMHVASASHLDIAIDSDADEDGGKSFNFQLDSDGHDARHLHPRHFGSTRSQPQSPQPNRRGLVAERDEINLDDTSISSESEHSSNPTVQVEGLFESEAYPKTAGDEVFFSVDMDNDTDVDLNYATQDSTQPVHDAFRSRPISRCESLLPLFHSGADGLSVYSEPHPWKIGHNNSDFVALGDEDEELDGLISLVDEAGSKVVGKEKEADLMLFVTSDTEVDIDLDDSEMEMDIVSDHDDPGSTDSNAAHSIRSAHPESSVDPEMVETQLQAQSHSQTQLQAHFDPSLNSEPSSHTCTSLEYQHEQRLDLALDLDSGDDDDVKVHNSESASAFTRASIDEADLDLPPNSLQATGLFAGRDQYHDSDLSQRTQTDTTSLVLAVVNDSEAAGNEELILCDSDSDDGEEHYQARFAPSSPSGFASTPGFTRDQADQVQRQASYLSSTRSQSQSIEDTRGSRTSSVSPSYTGEAGHSGSSSAADIYFGADSDVHRTLGMKTDGAIVEDVDIFLNSDSDADSNLHLFPRAKSVHKIDSNRQAGPRSVPRSKEETCAMEEVRVHEAKGKPLGLDLGSDAENLDFDG